MGTHNQKKNQIEPGLDQLEEILKWIRPQPSARYYERMKNVPWERRTVGDILFSTRKSMRLWTIGSIVIFFLGCGLMFSPVGQGAARRIRQYFRPEQTDRISFPTTLVPLIDERGTSFGLEFELSLAEVEEMTDLEIATITNTPEDIVFNGADYAPLSQSVRLLYSVADGYLVLTQRREDRIQEFASTGPETTIENVLVNNIPAEMVRGGWKIIPADQLVPGATATVTVQWDNNIPNITLRWQVGDHYYELLAIGSEWTTEKVIQLANSVK